MAACGAVQGHSALGQGLVVSRLASIEIDFIALLLIGYGAIRVSDDPNLEGKAKTTRSVRPADCNWVAIPGAWHRQATWFSPL
jgi:hypothetical protein